MKTVIGASIDLYSEENYSRSKFKQHQISYLFSSQTLEEYPHMSLFERATLLHRIIRELKISPKTIRRIYLKKAKDKVKEYQARKARD